MKTPDQGNGRNLGVLDDTYVTKGVELEINQKKKEAMENPSQTPVFPTSSNRYLSEIKKFRSRKKFNQHWQKFICGCKIFTSLEIFIWKQL
nr:hypothetical protein [uncultured Cohaesibacter sp.]